MNGCIACGKVKPEEQMTFNGYKEPLCLTCDTEILKEALEAFEDVCTGDLA